MTLRAFDVRSASAFDELELLSNDGSLWARDDFFRKGPQEVWGDSMYQVILALHG